MPVSHNALQHFPECHGAAGGGGTLPGPAGGGYPARSSWGGGVPCRGVPCHVQLGGYPARSSQRGALLGGTLLGGYPVRGVPYQGISCWGVTLLGHTLPGHTLPGRYPAMAVPCWGGTQVGMVPPPTRSGPGGTQLGQHREFLLHGGRYASCVHAGGLSCCNILNTHWTNIKSPLNILKCLRIVLWINPTMFSDFSGIF